MLFALAIERLVIRHCTPTSCRFGAVFAQAICCRFRNTVNDRNLDCCHSRVKGHDAVGNVVRNCAILPGKENQQDRSWVISENTLWAIEGHILVV